MNFIDLFAVMCDMGFMTINTNLVIKRIRAFAKYKGWTKSRLAFKAKLRDTTLRNFNQPDWNPTIKTLQKLEAIIPDDFHMPDINHTEEEK